MASARLAPLLGVVALLAACAAEGSDGSGAAAELSVADIGHGRIATGLYHSCAIAGDGRLFCWGDNRAGQLGNGSTTSSTTPVAVGTDTDWDSVTAGGFFTCALKKGSGKRYCWGNNGGAQLGNGGLNDSGRPLAVAGDDGYAQLSAGGEHGCGVKNDGTLVCWGDDGQGQVGASDPVGTHPRSLRPREVMPQTKWRSVSAGAYHSCAVKIDGTLWCWGNSFESGQAPPPAQVGGDTNWAHVDAGELVTCGIKASGALFCFGRNFYGEAGHPADGRDDTPPAQLGTDLDWAAVRAGPGHVCALKTDGALYCWGYNLDGQAGVPIDVTTISLSTPTAVAGTHLRDLDTGGSQSTDYETAHSCGVRVDGSVACWGNGSVGQLGNGTVQKYVGTPRQLGTDDDWASLGDGTWAMKRDGGLWRWGDTANLWLYTGGLSATLAVRQPTPQRMETPAARLGRGSMCYVATDGTLQCRPTCAGPIDLGIHSCATGFARVGSDTDWASVVDDVGFGGLCGLKTNGDLYCWIIGRTPALVSGGASHWKAVAKSEEHTCAVGVDGTLWCWGDNFFGQVGDVPSAQHDTPFQVGTDANWVDVAIGNSHSCALKADGSLWCFGEAQYAGVEMSERAVSTPTRIGAPTATYRSVAVQYLSTCAVATDGTAWCWGFGTEGQLGDGNATDSGTPVRVGGGFSDWVAVARGPFHSCGLRSNGTIWCWGQNDEAQIGLPVAWSDGPVDVRLP